MSMGEVLSHDENSLALAAHKTAIARKTPSLPSRRLLKHISTLVRQVEAGNDQLGDVIDFGAGRGKDVLFYCQKGLDAQGFDPHAEFGFNQKPERQFRVGTTMFVLNVIPTQEKRIQALGELFEMITKGGYAVIVTRSPEAVEHEAKAHLWQKWGDGYVSDPRKNTFQRGMSADEIKLLGLEVGFNVARTLQTPTIPNASVAILRK